MTRYGLRGIAEDLPDLFNVRFGLKVPAPGRGREGQESLRVFGCLPGAGARRCTEAGVRKASREETAGGVRTGGGVRLWRVSTGV